MDEKKRFQIIEAIGVITRLVETDNDFVWYGITSIGRFISPILRCPGNTDSLETHCDSDKLQPGDVVHVVLEVMPKWIVHKSPFVAITCRPTSVPSIHTYFIGGSDNFYEKRLIIRCKIDFVSYDEGHKADCYNCEIVDRVYDTSSLIDKTRGSCLAEIAANCLTKFIPRFFVVFAVIKYLDGLPPATDSSSGSPTVLRSGDLQLTDEHYDRKETIGMITGASNLIRFGISPVGLFVMNSSTHMQLRKNPVIGDIVEVVLRETPKGFAYADKHPFVALSCRIVPTPPSLQISLRKNAYGEQLFVRCMISRLDYEVLDSDDDFYKCEIYERVRDPYRRVDETRCPCIADLKMQRVEGRWTLAVYAVVNCLQRDIPPLPSSFDDEVTKADEARRTVGIITRTYDQLRFGFSPLGKFSILFETVMEEPEHSSELCVGDVVELLLAETPASQREVAKDRLKALSCHRVPAPPSVEIYFREGGVNGFLTVRCKITYSGFDEESNFHVYDSELCGKVHDIRRIVDRRRRACIADLTPRRLFGKETVVFSVHSVLEYCEAATPGGHDEPPAPASGERHQQVRSEVEKGYKTIHPAQSPTNEFVDSGVSITGSSRIFEDIRESSNDQSWESLLRRVIKDRNVRGVLRTENPDLYDEVMDRLMD